MPSKGYFVEGQVIDEPRVYVNNMNTRHATVTLPPYSSRRSMVASKILGLYGTDDEVGNISGNGSRFPPDASSHSNVADTNPHVSSSETRYLADEGMHPNLEFIYKRIMRRLQRQINYDELARVPLAEQYGISPASDDDDNTISPTDDAFSDMQKPHLMVAGPLTVSASSATSVTSRSRMGGHPTSTRSTGASTKITSISPSDDTLDGEERMMAQQPCPRPLRLVIQHVKDTLQCKLRLAETGSLRDCLRFVFECRALLDRLLKETPMYMHFQGVPEHLPVIDRVSDNRGGPHSRPRRAPPLQKMIEEFKQTPSFLPRGEYARVQATGSVRAVLDHSAEEALRRTQSNVVEHPVGQHPTEDCSGRNRDGSGPTALSPARRTTILAQEMSKVSNSIIGGLSEKGGQQPLEVQLPASYGKSLRLVPESFTSSAGTGGGGAAVNSFPTRPPCSGGDVVCDGNSDFLQGAGRKRRHLFNPIQHVETKPTQVTSVGTLTEENTITMVTRAAYDELLERTERLELEIAEQKQERLSLTKRLSEEANYTDSKARVVQYLRETLFKECNILRSQLAFAAQKEQQLQNVIRRQAHSHGGNSGNAHTLSVSTAPVLQSQRAPRSCERNAVASQNCFSSGAGSSNNTVGDAGVLSVPAGASAVAVGVSGPMSAHRMTAGSGAPASTLHAAGLPAKDEVNDFVSGAGGGGHPPSTDISAVQSLLDLAMLAVERDETLPMSAEQVMIAGPCNVHDLMLKDPKKQAEATRAYFTEKEKRLKESLMQVRVDCSYTIASKDAEIDRLRKLIDTECVRKGLMDQVEKLRAELRKQRTVVMDQFHLFQVLMDSTKQSVLNRTKMVDRTMRDNAELQNTQSALMDMISSARALLVPMVTNEYERGYHPWPMKIRNTVDPLASVIQSRYGAAETLRVQEPLSILSEVYLAVHQYVMKKSTIPIMTWPATGETLRSLCAAMVISPLSKSNVVTLVRERCSEDRKLAAHIAKLNAQILWSIYCQRTLSERSVAALLSAGMDPHVTSLPAATRINRLATVVATLSRERAVQQKARMDNAKEVYRLWKEQQIDIYHGYPPPSTQGRLSLLPAGQATSSRMGAGGRNFAGSGSPRTKSLVA